MKTNYKDMHVYFIYSFASSFLLLLYLRSPIDAGCALGGMIITTLFVSKLRHNVSTSLLTRLAANHFTQILVKEWQGGASLDEAYQHASHFLPCIDFNRSFEEVQQNPDCLDSLPLGQNRFAIKKLISGKEDVDGFIILGIAESSYKEVQKDCFIKETDSMLMAVVLLEVFFCLMRFVFGVDLLPYSNIIFRTISSICFYLPLLLTGLGLYLKEKQYEKANIF